MPIWAIKKNEIFEFEALSCTTLWFSGEWARFPLCAFYVLLIFLIAWGRGVVGVNARRVGAVLAARIKPGSNDSRLVNALAARLWLPG